MTVVEHLAELRYRLMVSLVAFLVAMIVAYIFYRPILEFLRRPLDETGRIGGVRINELPLYATGITGPFMLRLRVSAFAGLLGALPVMLYQLWRFITPGLLDKERKLAVPFVASSVVLFSIGAWFAFLVLPTGVRFLLSFVEPGFQEPFITFQEYVSFITMMVLGFGLSFEFPLFLVFLGLVGVLDSRQLRSWRRYALFVAFLVSAIATPSGDPFTMTAMAVPLYVLYEGSILVVRFALKK